ncbi:sigma-70 family RNA polymerase sigma factor [Lederbergia citrea]|uniref:sigma-70 family RNA polymerase sigma factor n=1 Tax=Lederbergia citrea TaxID=2833581 RepID=UPI001BC9CFB6|nr:sigma-70 family RNA polymerase sigma factor [Lederbergia citrea]MBS4204840.1 sigma-70 family RNA polymerase sigma factor [Lederbergia citrea]
MESFEDLVEQYTPMIHHMIRSLHIYKNVEEFYQTGVIALWEAQGRYNPDKGKFSTLAYSYIKGRMMTELTRQKKVEENNVYPEETFWEATVDHGGEEPLQLSILLSYCANLTDKQKQWVVYTFYHDMTIQEIADAEKVSLTAVKKWRTGAMGKIRENVEEGIMG